MKFFLGYYLNFSALFLIPSRPPIPEPTITPVFIDCSSFSTCHEESSIASLAAISAYSINGSIFFLSFCSITLSEINPLFLLKLTAPQPEILSRQFQTLTVFLFLILKILSFSSSVRSHNQVGCTFQALLLQPSSFNF